MAGNDDNRTMGRLVSLSSIGMEMVVPVAVGAFLDHRYGWEPWGAVAGAVFGLVGGISHMLMMLRQQDDSPPSKSSREEL
jgi:F0F1-type ATP synthase assembly protein I